MPEFFRQQMTDASTRRAPSGYDALVDDLTIIRDKIESLRQFTNGDRDIKGGILDAQLFRARCVIEDAMWQLRHNKASETDG